MHFNSLLQERKVLLFRPDVVKKIKACKYGHSNIYLVSIIQVSFSAEHSMHL